MPDTLLRAGITMINQYKRKHLQSLEVIGEGKK